MKPVQWRWLRRTLLGLALAGLVLVLVRSVPLGASLFGLALVAIVLAESSRLRQLIVEGQRQHHAHLQIRPLLGDLPVELGHWAIDPILAHHLVRLVGDTRPELVLECGGGSTTVLIARCLRAIGRGKLISLEHDPAFAQRTQELARRNGVADIATVVIAPLAARELDGTVMSWYGPQYEPLLDRPIDLLLVDGPPGNLGRHSRYPALPLLQRHLAPECWILLDDGDRIDERTIAKRWSSELGARLTYLAGGRGGWLIHRNPGNSQELPS